jgi:hypothetical protein
MGQIYKVTEADGSTRDIVATESFVEQYYPGRWVLVGNKPPPPPLPLIITKLAMITRFTDDEYTGILAAAKTDVQVQGWLDRFYAANTVSLEDQRTIDGISLLVSKNLLEGPVNDENKQSRAYVILNTPVNPGERP